MAYFFTAQHYAIDLTGAASNTAAISSVSTSLTCLSRPSWSNTGTSDNRSDWCRTALTSGTVVTASRDGTTGNIIVYGSAITFDAAVIQSIQRGTISIGTSTTSNTATISSVTKNNSIIIFDGCAAPAGGSAAHQYYNATVELTNGTTVTARVNSALSTTQRTVGYTVVEFVSGALAQAVQHLSLSTTTTSSDHTVTAVTLANAILFHNGQRAGAENIGQVKLSMTSTTNVRATKDTSGTTPVEACLVEFVSGKVSVQHNLSNAHAQNDQTKDGAITTVDRTKAFVNFAGYQTLGDEPDEARIGVAFLDDDTVRSYRGGASTSASTDTSNIGYQVVSALDSAGGTTTPQAVNATVVAVATITKKVKKNLSVQVPAVATVSRKTKKNLAATVLAVATMTRKTQKTLAATVLAVATIATARKYAVLLEATVTAVATISTRKVFLALLEVTVTATATMTRKTKKILSVYGFVTPTMTRKTGKLLSVTVPVVATIARPATFRRTLQATAQAVATIATAKTAHVLLQATVTAVATIAARPIYAVLMQATVPVVATMTRKTRKTLAATVQAVASMTRKTKKPLPVTVTAVATMTETVAFRRTLSVQVVAVATMSEQFEGSTPKFVQDYINFWHPYNRA